MSNQLVPLFEMARRLHVTTKWLRAEVDARRLPAIRAGNQLIFNPAIVERELLKRVAAAEPREVSDADR